MSGMMDANSWATDSRTSRQEAGEQSSALTSILSKNHHALSCLSLRMIGKLGLLVVIKLNVVVSKDHHMLN